MRSDVVSASRVARAAVACVVVAVFIAAASPAAAAPQDVVADPPSLLVSTAAAVAQAKVDSPTDDCVRQLKSAESRRTKGRLMTTVGVGAAFYGYGALAIGNICAQEGRCNDHLRYAGAGLLAGGVTLTALGIERTHHAKADVKTLVVQPACVARDAAGRPPVATPPASIAPAVPPLASPPQAAGVTAWTQALAHANARRSAGHKQLAIGIVAVVIGEGVVRSASPSAAGTGQLLLGSSLSTIGFTTAILGQLKAHDAGMVVDALTARGPSPGGVAVALPAGPHQSVGVNLGRDSRSMIWRITW